MTGRERRPSAESRPRLLWGGDSIISMLRRIAAYLDNFRMSGSFSSRRSVAPTLGAIGVIIGRLGAPGPAAADVLMSNLGQGTRPANDDLKLSANNVFKRFTTGNNISGYCIHSVSIDFAAGSTSPLQRVPTLPERSTSGCFWTGPPSSPPWSPAASTTTQEQAPRTLCRKRPRGVTKLTAGDANSAKPSPTAGPGQKKPTTKGASAGAPRGNNQRQDRGVESHAQGAGRLRPGLSKSRRPARRRRRVRRALQPVLAPREAGLSHPLEAREEYELRQAA